jgi:hypothetical protein
MVFAITHQANPHEIMECFLRQIMRVTQGEKRTTIYISERKSLAVAQARARAETLHLFCSLSPGTKPRAAAGVWETFHCSRFGRLPEPGNEFSLAALALAWPPSSPRANPFIYWTETSQRQAFAGDPCGLQAHTVLLHEVRIHPKKSAKGDRKKQV